MERSGLLFWSDAYRRETEAVIIAITDAGIICDRSVFFPGGGGQPGDCGWMTVADQRAAQRPAAAVTEAVKHVRGVVHPLEDAARLQLGVGDRVHLSLDWARRYLHMRMHTALHLLCGLVASPVTGAAISADKGRLDFDLPAAPDKEALTAKLQALVQEDRPISERWISKEEFAARPELCLSPFLRPPAYDNQVRLVEIAQHDLQACGGTHLKTTAEVGAVRVSKSESKGRHNRRLTIVLED